MFELGPESKAELDEFCADLKPGEAKSLRQAIDRVKQDPWGYGIPGHRYTKPHHPDKRYLHMPSGTRVLELKVGNFRGLFTTTVVKRGDREYRRIDFVRIRGRRFMTAGDAPWHKGGRKGRR